MEEKIRKVVVTVTCDEEGSPVARCTEPKVSCSYLGDTLNLNVKGCSAPQRAKKDAAGNLTIKLAKTISYEVRFGRYVDEQRVRKDGVICGEYKDLMRTNNER